MCVSIYVVRHALFSALERRLWKMSDAQHPSVFEGGGHTDKTI